MATAARAIVATEPGDDFKPGSNWELQEISVPEKLGDGELLVQVVASGICHTDLLTTAFPPGTPGVAPYPKIAGHEGSGYVKAIGPNVTKEVKVGDPVLLSFDYCNDCESCKTGRPSYCSNFFARNIFNVEDVFKTKDGKGISGKSFGQSSFANLSIVNQACVLPVQKFIQSEKDLHLFAPLGCGIQTGAGAMLNVAKPVKSDRVMILGLGGVGLSAIMAAHISGAQQIVAVDKVKSRIELAKSFGATHGLDTTGVEDLAAKFKEITGGEGPTVVADATGYLPVLQAGYDSLAPHGAFVFIGANTEPGYELKIDITKHMMNGSRLLGCCEGESVPHEFIPRLIEHYRKGQLPIDKIIKFYKADDFKTALHDMHTGETIKPVVLW